jgi:hypothetical protein
LFGDTDALNCWPWPVITEAVVGVTETEIGLVGSVTVAVAVPKRFGTAFETALMVTAAGFGTRRGAVYMPPVEIMPIVEFPPATPFTCHCTT